LVDVTHAGAPTAERFCFLFSLRDFSLVFRALNRALTPLGTPLFRDFFSSDNIDQCFVSLPIVVIVECRSAVARKKLGARLPTVPPTQKFASLASRNASSTHRTRHSKLNKTPLYSRRGSRLDSPRGAVGSPPSDTGSASPHSPATRGTDFGGRRSVDATPTPASILHSGNTNATNTHNAKSSVNAAAL
jgi:hypothetical protein